MRGSPSYTARGFNCARPAPALKVLVLGDLPQAAAEGLTRAAGVQIRVVGLEAWEDCSGGEIDAILLGPGGGREMERLAGTVDEVAVVDADAVGGPDGAGLAVAVAEAATRARSARRQRTRLRWLERDAGFDRLTGLRSRCALDEQLSHMRDESPASLAVLAIDVQEMALVNDLYGRDAGDHALAALGQAVLRSVRHTDFAARWGGDKIVVLFPGGNLATCRKAARRVARELAEATRADLSIPPLVPAFGMAASSASDPAEAVAEALAQAAERGARAPAPLWTPLSDGPCVA